jgi:hypothetical protein
VEPAEATFEPRPALAPGRADAEGDRVAGA